MVRVALARGMGGMIRQASRGKEKKDNESGQFGERECPLRS